MNIRRIARSCLTLSALLLSGSLLMACGVDDDEDADGTSPGRDRDVSGELDVSVGDPNQDTAGDQETDTTSPNPDPTCDPLPRPAQVGQPCAAPGDCDGECVVFEENATSGTCYATCNPGVCEDACITDEVCAPLSGPGGQPATDANGTPIGACVVPPEGTEGAYAACGQGIGNCQSGNTCAILEQEAQNGICMPDCTAPTDCPPLGNAQIQCVQLTGPGGEQIPACAPICAAPTDCPGGYTCTAVQGGSVCIPD